MLEVFVCTTFFRRNLLNCSDWVPNRGACIDTCLSDDVARGFLLHDIKLTTFLKFYRWDYPNKFSDFEAFRYLKENGVKAEYLRNIFPTLTAPSHFSIATGIFSSFLHLSFYLL